MRKDKQYRGRTGSIKLAKTKVEFTLEFVSYGYYPNQICQYYRPTTSEHHK